MGGREKGGGEGVDEAGMRHRQTGEEAWGWSCKAVGREGGAWGQLGEERGGGNKDGRGGRCVRRSDDGQ